MLTSIAGARFAYNAGDVVDVAIVQAQQWIANGIAERVDDPESAMIEASETAVKPRTRRRRKQQAIAE